MGDEGARRSIDIVDSSSDDDNLDFVVNNPVINYETKIGFKSDVRTPPKLMKGLMIKMIPAHVVEFIYDPRTGEGEIKYLNVIHAKAALNLIKNIRWPTGGGVEAWMIPDEIDE